ncbi:MAG: TraB/GumN family protein [Rhizobiaceae bacterium]|nr:TraB/GumN family protein [Rhizobiaceae bacterium]
MRRAIAHAIPWFAGLVAAANLLFLLAFAATLLFATAQVRAEVACTGQDLIAKMAVEEPGKLAAVRAEAAAEPNGHGLLWRVEKPGTAPSFLFGTMHMSDPRVTKLPAAAETAFGSATSLVIETTDVLDQSKITEAMLTHPHLMMFTDDGSLPALLSPEDRALVEAALAERGIALAAVQKMKPWIIAALVSLPACELARKSAGEPVLDILLAERAKERGIAVQGLESMVDQLEAMASLPMEFHVRGLVDTLKLGDGIDDVMETMLVLYAAGDIAAVWPFFRAVMPAQTEGDEAGFAAFQEAMIVSRNKVMSEEAAPYFDAGGAFVAVGALHLPGADGLVELLRASGYTVTRVE